MITSLFLQCVSVKDVSVEELELIAQTGQGQETLKSGNYCDCCHFVSLFVGRKSKSFAEKCDGNDPIFYLDRLISACV
jgi:hypothetical protein